MIASVALGPPSPPTSPRMSDIHGKNDELQWDQSPAPERSTHALPQPALTKDVADSMQQNRNALSRPPLRSIKSFPYSLGPSGRIQNESAQEDTNGFSNGFKEQVLSQGPQPTASADLAQPTFGGSAPTSPVERLTPRSQETAMGQDDAAAEDDEMDVEVAEQEEEAERPPMTAAELRAHKRKMKRFRLTHNQTRFLMSEFARQPHPDAAHRERLSREIPGLSPRQVQVWFQNRRAKLKRLTTDDRERMMRSRALPADFDMMQALRAPFGAPTPASGTTPDNSPGGLNSFSHQQGGVRPLTLDTLRRVPDYEPFNQNFASPSGITPAIGSFAFTPPQSATDTISPSSAIGMSPFSYQPHESPRRPGYGLSLNTQAGYAVQNAQMARHHLHERFGRPLGEMAGSPLRSSISYSGLSSHVAGQSQPQQQTRSNSMSEHGHYTHERATNSRNGNYSNLSSSGPYGLGFTYPQLSTYQPSEQITQTSSAATYSHADLPSYRTSTSSAHSGLPASSITYGGYPSSTTYSSMPHYAQYTSQYTPQAFQAPFPTHASEQQDRHRQLQHSITQASPHSAVPAAQLFPAGVSAFQGEVDEDEESEGANGVSASF